MKTQVVKIGNARGVCIPQILLEHSSLSGVRLEVGKGSVTIRALGRVRKGWAEAFEMMAERDDNMLLDESSSC